MKIACCFVVIAYLVMPPCAAATETSEPLAWRFAHDDAQIIAGVDFQRLHESAEGRSLRDRFASALGPQLVRHADRLIMSSVFDADGKRSDLIVLSGSFGLSELRRVAGSEGARITPFQGMEIAAPPGSSARDPHLAWSTGREDRVTVLIGTRPGVQAAAVRARNRPDSLRQSNPLFARAFDLSAQYPIWVACDSVPVGFGPPGLDEQADNEEIEGIDVGVGIGQTAALNLWFWTDAEIAAANAFMTLQSAAGTRGNFVLSPWLTELKGTLEGGTLALGAHFPVAQADARVASLLSAFGLPLDNSAPRNEAASQPQLQVRAKVHATVPVTGLPAVPAIPDSMFTPAVFPPAPKSVVRIQGLDEGTQEIPFTPKR
jgi:hypothetical protein